MTTIKELEKTVGELSERVKSLETPAVSVASTSVDNPGVSLTSATSRFPIPVEYSQIVENTLNKKFGVDISYSGDSASFEFSILVPEEYSNAGKPHWETYKEDRRTRVINNALGVNGVAEWCTKVYENFGPETKAKIVFDRAQL